MPYNTKERQAEYGRQHYQANKALYCERARVSRKQTIMRNRAYVNAMKEA